MPLISIIVPVYNCAGYIEKTVESLSQQTYPSIEIILVDDGSTDESYSICERLAGIDERIKLCRQAKNLGVSCARNTGMRMAKGDYIGFVDADDFVEANCYSKLYEGLTKTGAAVAKTGITVEYPGKTEEVGKSAEQKLLTSEEALVCFLKGQISRSVCTSLFTSENLSGLFFEEGRAHNEDAYITFQSILKSDRFFVDDSCLYHYKKRPFSASTQEFHPGKLDILYFSEKICDAVIEQYPQHSDLANAYFTDNCLYLFRQIFKSKNYAAYASERQTIKHKMLTSPHFSPSTLGLLGRLELYGMLYTPSAYQFSLLVFTKIRTRIIWKGSL